MRCPPSAFSQQGNMGLNFQGPKGEKVLNPFLNYKNQL